MTNSFALFRSLVMYAICLPLAIWLGYMVATPYTVKETVMTVVIPLSLLSVPLFLRWHYPWMIACWNMNALLFFLPGQPAFWTFLILISFTISILRFVLDPKQKFISVPSITRPLIFLAVVVLVTAQLTGGIHLGALGASGNVGGRRYFWLLIGIVGYFALAAHRIRPEKATFYVTLFFIGFVTFAIGSAAGIVTKNLDFIFQMFPVDGGGYASLVGASTISGPTEIARYGGISTGALGLIYILLSRYGVEGVARLGKIWRPLLCFMLAGVSMYGGYRSMAITLFLTTGILLYFEGILRSRFLPIIVLGGIVAMTFLFAFAQSLPLPVQRSLTFLPVRFTESAEEDAKGTTEWRTKMWSEVLPEVPPHLILGKGYSVNATELALVDIAQRFHREENTALGPTLAGDYHNGPLSVIVPFGIPGAIGFLWFLAVGARALYRNYKFGDSALTRINRFLLAYYLMKIIMFFTVFGSLYSDFVSFTGLVGLSVALNNGARGPVVAAPVRPVLNKFRVALAGR